MTTRWSGHCVPLCGAWSSSGCGLAKRAQARAVLAEFARDGQRSASHERARAAWERGARRRRRVVADDEADPVAAFVEDMEAGLQVHQRLLEQRRRPGRAADEVVNDG